MAGPENCYHGAGCIQRSRRSDCFFGQGVLSAAEACCPQAAERLQLMWTHVHKFSYRAGTMENNLPHGQPGPILRIGWKLCSLFTMISFCSYCFFSSLRSVFGVVKIPATRKGQVHALQCLHGWSLLTRSFLLQTRSHCAPIHVSISRSKNDAECASV